MRPTRWGPKVGDETRGESKGRERVMDMLDERTLPSRWLPMGVRRYRAVRPRRGEDWAQFVRVYEMMCVARAACTCVTDRPGKKAAAFESCQECEELDHVYERAHDGACTRAHGGACNHRARAPSESMPGKKPESVMPGKRPERNEMPGRKPESNEIMNEMPGREPEFCMPGRKHEMTLWPGREPEILRISQAIERTCISMQRRLVGHILYRIEKAQKFLARCVYSEKGKLPAK